MNRFSWTLFGIFFLFFVSCKGKEDVVCDIKAIDQLKIQNLYGDWKVLFTLELWREDTLYWKYEKIDSLYWIKIFEGGKGEYESVFFNGVETISWDYQFFPDKIAIDAMGYLDPNDYIFDVVVNEPDFHKWVETKQSGFQPGTDPNVIKDETRITTWELTRR